MMHERFPLLAAGLLGATGVLLGAFGQHLLRDLLLGHGTRTIWETAVYFHLFHAAALLGLAGWMRPIPHGVAAHRAARAARLLVAGTVIFSGSLYAFALGAPRFFAWLTPIGGVALIAGWLYAAGAAVAPRSEYDL